MNLISLAVLLSAPLAEAYEPRAVNNCAAIHWPSSPEVVLHTSEMAGFTAQAEADMRQAMRDIHGVFNEVRGTTAEVTAMSSSSAPFVWRTWFNDASPTIHVGWTSDPNEAIGVTTWKVDDTTCEIEEVHMQFRNPSIFDWSFNTPGDYGEDYFDSGISGPDGRYFRISYIHELLHAYGFAHSNSTYSMLNYCERPWANAPASRMIRPLPDDMTALRDTYPAPRQAARIAVLNTFWEENISSTSTYPAGNQYMICAPSGGGSWADTDADVCGHDNGVPASNAICPGDNVRVRFALANYSTEDVDLTARLFVTPTNYPTASTPRRVSPVTRDISVPAGSSRIFGRNFELPQLPNGVSASVVIFVSGTTTSGARVADWIPMRGGITVPSPASCAP